MHSFIEFHKEHLEEAFSIDFTIVMSILIISLMIYIGVSS